MMRLSLEEAAVHVNGILHGENRIFEGLSTDSRSVGAGELFVAIRGPSFDGRDYVPGAMARGACGALVESPVDGVPCIHVPDARAALLPLAGAWRDRFEVDTVAVTGSNGKTTVKEMIAAILAQDAAVLATHGNLNNDIGLPLTLARLDSNHRRLVLEMGANHAGEIAALAAVARPRVGVITLIAPAHLEGFGSIEGVARAKGEIFEKVEKLQDIAEPKYIKIVEQVAKKYAAKADIDPEDLEDFVYDAKRYWSIIEKRLEK